MGLFRSLSMPEGVSFVDARFFETPPVPYAYVPVGTDKAPDARPERVEGVELAEWGSGASGLRLRAGRAPLDRGRRDLRRRGPAPRGLPHPRDVRGREVPTRPHPREVEEADVDPRGGPPDRQGVGGPRRPVRHPAPVHEEGG